MTTRAPTGNREGRVLIVDDEPMSRETLSQVLSGEGYVVDLAVDGETALECICASRPDAILLDLMMPGMSGRQFLQVLREDPHFAHVAHVPVMLMSAAHGLEVNPATLGASHFLEKPFNVDELLDKVSLAVYRAREPSNHGITQPQPVVAPPPEAVPVTERGVVMLVEHDRSRLEQLDRMLSARGYTVVSMTRAHVQLPRLARALRPRAILLEWVSEGVEQVVRDLADTNGCNQIPILVFSRTGDPSIPPGTLERAADVDLVGFVDAQREQQPSS